jgi:His-Xaa-Ser system protein HxsD
MKGIVNITIDGKCYITLDNETYQKEAVMAAAYKMTDSCTILITPTENKKMNLIFEPLSGQAQEDLEKIAKDFCNEVLDQQIRLDLEKRFGKIRELIVEHAFSPLDLHKEVKSL